MSEAGGIIRNRGNAADASSEAAVMLKQLPGKIGAGSVSELADSFLLLDHCITHFVYLESIRYYLENGGRSRGSYIVTEKGNMKNDNMNESDRNPELCMYDRDIENKVLEVGFKKGIIRINLENIRDIPKQNLWFEKVWKEYLEDKYLDC